MMYHEEFSDLTNYDIIISLYNVKSDSFYILLYFYKLTLIRYKNTHQINIEENNEHNKTKVLTANVFRIEYRYFCLSSPHFFLAG